MLKLYCKLMCIQLRTSQNYGNFSFDLTRARTSNYAQTINLPNYCFLEIVLLLSHSFWASRRYLSYCLPFLPFLVIVHSFSLTEALTQVVNIRHFGFHSRRTGSQSTRRHFPLVGDWRLVQK